MEITHIEHIGIAVRSIEEQLPYYEGVLGLKCYNIETVEDQKVKTAFSRSDKQKLNYWNLPAKTVPLPNSLKKRRGYPPHRFCHKNLEEALREIEAKGIRLIDIASQTGSRRIEHCFSASQISGWRAYRTL